MNSNPLELRRCNQESSTRLALRSLRRSDDPELSVTAALKGTGGQLVGPGAVCDEDRGLIKTD